MVVLLLRAAELNMFISEVDEQVVKKTGLRWVLSTLGEEPLARELIEKGVRLIFFFSIIAVMYMQLTTHLHGSCLQGILVADCPLESSTVYIEHA